LLSNANESTAEDVIERLRKKLGVNGGLVEISKIPFPLIA